jgi:hypothetical protein
MSLQAFVELYEQFTLDEQASFEEVVQRLLSDGSLWREGEQERRLYEFLRSHLEPVGAYLEVSGWELHHYEQYKLFHITHRDGRNRYPFTAEQTRLLLLLRLLYAEGQEQRMMYMTDMRRLPTRYPIITPGEVVQEFFSTYGMRISRTALHDHLRLFGRFKLLRILWRNGQKDISSAEIELFPFLEVIIGTENVNEMMNTWMKGGKKGSHEEAGE